MPFQPGNKCGNHGNHARGFKCRNLNQLKNMRWVRKGDQAMRVPADELKTYLVQGWEKGRLSPNDRTRQKQSESQKSRTDYARLSKTPEGRRNRGYKTRYKRTTLDYDQKLTYQDEHCALCPSTGSVKRRLCWDHDHSCCPGYKSCGKCIRGLLCIPCNNLIGRLEGFLKAGSFVPKPGTWEEAAMKYILEYQQKGESQMKKATIGCAQSGKQEPSIFVCDHILYEKAQLGDYQEYGEVSTDEPDFEQPGFAFCDECVEDEDRLKKGKLVCFPCFEKQIMPKFQNA